MSEEMNTTPADTQAGGGSAPSAAGIVSTFMAVVTRPGEFFTAMPRTGGFVQPLIFMIVMGVAAGIVRAVLGILGLVHGLPMAMALASIILTPIFVVIFGFIGAAILFVIWKIMGSEQDFETAYRCTAYGGAISPITQLFAVIPYLGSVLALAWWTLILVLASTRVHKIRQGVAATVFGIIAVLLALASIGAQITARRMESALNNAQNKMQYGQDGTKQDPGKAMQDLGKMLQKMGKDAQSQGGSN